MKKSKLTAFLAVLFILILSIYYVKIHYQVNSAQATLIKGYNNSGAEFISSEIYVWGRIESSRYNVNNLKLMARDIFDQLGIQSSGDFSEKYDNSDIQKIELKGTTENGIAADINIQAGNGPGSDSASVISASVTDYAGYSAMEDTAKIILETFKYYHIKPVISSCIVGSYPGELDNSRVDDILRRVFQGAGARKVENIKDGNLVSVSAYSPLIEESIKVNGKDVNLNLAIRYNSHEMKTYIWLAAPVITTEY